ncbi:glycosyltransferase 87 family protein [Actinomadura sp. 3N407]|uniref:glycosyltransferase 87 family protein n=1 Tax=Actinomadura sp. 3N407 TaxID=3457423 RepID=UPI003FCCA21E
MAAALILELAALSVILGLNEFHSLDFDVYRAASAEWWNGGSVHDLPEIRTATGPLKLVLMNPPVAAATLAPVTLLPRGLGIALWFAVSLAALACVVHLFARVIAPRFSGLNAWHLTLAVLPVLTLLGPVRDELTFGQMNIVLMAMVAADCLTPRPRWPRGLLLGLAISIKVLPGVFLLFFLLRKDTRALLVSAAGFAIGTAAGFAVAFDDSLDYWTKHLFDSDRVTDLVGWWWSPNQSLVGLTERFHWAPVPGALVVMLYAAVLAMTVLAMRNMFRMPGYGAAAALVVNAMPALLWAPTSWTYHWVWVVPGLMILAALAVERRDLMLGTVTAFVAAVFYIGPPWLMQFYDGSERHWSVVEFVAGDAYPLIALAMLGALAGMGARSPVRPREVETAAPEATGGTEAMRS